MFTPGDEYRLSQFVKLNDMYKTYPVDTAIAMVKEIIPPRLAIEEGYEESFGKVIGGGAFGLVCQYGTTHAIKFIMYHTTADEMDPDLSHEVIMIEAIERIAVNHPDIYTHLVPCRILSSHVPHPGSLQIFKDVFIDTVRMPLAHASLSEYLRTELFNGDRFMQRRTHIWQKLHKSALVREQARVPK